MAAEASPLGLFWTVFFVTLLARLNSNNSLSRWKRVPRPNMTTYNALAVWSNCSLKEELTKLIEIIGNLRCICLKDFSSSSYHSYSILYLHQLMLNWLLGLGTCLESSVYCFIWGDVSISCMWVKSISSLAWFYIITIVYIVHCQLFRCVHMEKIKIMLQKLNSNIIITIVLCLNNK